MTFPFDKLTRFVGLEADEQLLVHPDDLRRDYLEAFGRFRRELIDLAHRNRCEYVLVDTPRSLAEVLGDYLQQRSQQGRRI